MFWRRSRIQRSDFQLAWKPRFFLTFTTAVFLWFGISSTCMCHTYDLSLKVNKNGNDCYCRCDLSMYSLWIYLRGCVYGVQQKEREVRQNSVDKVMCWDVKTYNIKCKICVTYCMCMLYSCMWHVCLCACAYPYADKYASVPVCNM